MEDKSPLLKYMSLDQIRQGETEYSRSQTRNVPIDSPVEKTDAKFIKSQLKAQSKVKFQLLILPMFTVFTGAGVLISSLEILNVCTHPAKPQAKINKGQLTLCIISLFLCLIACVVCILKTRSLLKSKNKIHTEETSLKSTDNPDNFFKKNHPCKKNI